MLLALLLAAAPADTVRYAVSFPNAVHHEARIQVEFPAVGRDTLEVWMSRSSPGRYALHEFAKNVYDVSATDAAGRALPVVRTDPYRWLVVSRGRAVRLGYTLFGDRMRDPRIAEAGALSVRPLVGASLNPLARVGEQAVISFLPTGSIAIMNYGYRLISAIGGSVLFRSVIVVTLPRLTRATAEGRDAEVRQLTRLGVQIMLAVSVPLTALMAVLARPAVIAVFRRERFSAEDATLLGTVLAVYAASLVGSAVQRALLAPFFARLDTKVPLRNTLYGVVANLALLPLLVLPFGDDPNGVVGVAIAYAAAQYVNVAHAWSRLRRDMGIRLAGVGDTAIRLAIAGVAMAGAMAVAVSVLQPESAASRVARPVDIAIAGAIGVVVFAGVAAALGLLGLGRPVPIGPRRRGTGDDGPGAFRGVAGYGDLAPDAAGYGDLAPDAAGGGPR